MYALALVEGRVKFIEESQTFSGLDVINFELRVPRKDKGKEYVNRFRVSAFGGGVVELKKKLRLREGMILSLLGRLQTEEWTDSSGAMKRSTNIVYIKGWVYDS